MAGDARKVVPMPSPSRALAAALLALSLPMSDPAAAGAWTRTPGETQVIATAGLRGAPLAAGEEDDGQGGVAQLYAEHGLAEGFTVGAKVIGDFVPGDPDRGSAAAGVFGRYRLWQGEGAVASVQLDVQAPIERLFGEAFARSKPFSVAEAALRGLYGRSWWGDWGSAFVSTGAGYALRGEGRAGQALAEATFGIEPFDCCLGMLSAYGRVPVEEDGTDEQLTLQPSAVWHLRRSEDGRPSTSAQLGVSYDVLNPEDGAGLFLGLWQTF